MTFRVSHAFPIPDFNHSATAIAIGNFDGVHLGHQELIRHLKDDAKKLGVPSVVLTFYPHPVEVVHPTFRLIRLMTTDEKLQYLEAMGVDHVHVLKFDQKMAQTEAKTFFDEVLVSGLKAKSIRVGENFCFGRGRKGTTETLKVFAAANQIQVQVEKALSLDGARVSSTRIREMIQDGKVTEAARLLGRSYAIKGRVVPGDSRGKTIGFPTANLKVAHDKLVPAKGVYATWAEWQKQRFASVSNIGVRPTFGDGKEVVIEVHLLDFQSKIYDEEINLVLVDRLRDEQRFDSVDKLKEAIQQDIVSARRKLQS